LLRLDGMSSKPREWPNVAREARDRAAEETQEALDQIEDLLKMNCSESDVLLRVGRAVGCLNRALRFLEGVGAPTRPV